jgi:hypothetical protein
MNFLYFLNSLSLVILILLIVNVFKPFIGSYSAKKGENLATKEDIAQLTKIAEGIRAEISDKYWDRQKQWEMRRDAVYDAWGALCELGIILIKLRTAFSLAIPDSEDLKNSVLSFRYNAAAQFDACYVKYSHAKDLADMVVGKELPKHLAAYFQSVGIIANKIINGDTEYFTSERMKELAGIYKEILQEARKELNIKNSDDVVI